MDLVNIFFHFCKKRGIPYNRVDSVKSYNDSTYFCPAGMQQFTENFISGVGETQANVQSCIRMNDIDELGDGVHLLKFNMLGLFSFNDMSMRDAIHFWMDYTQAIGIKVMHVTIHPDKMVEWSKLYDRYDVEIRADRDCIWSDGNITGYCTEFYYKGLEIGNIVNPMGKHIDAGFGLERLDLLVNGTEVNEVLNLKDTCRSIIELGIVPGNKRHGYFLRQLLTRMVNMGVLWDNLHFLNEKARNKRLIDQFLNNRTKDKYRGKTAEWWYETMGVPAHIVEKYTKN